MSGAVDARAGSDRAGAADVSAAFGTVRGMTLEEVKSLDALPPTEHGLWELIWSDYLAQYGARNEPAGARAAMLIPRVIVNPSLSACVLVRLIQGTPLWLTWLWRRLLITLHGCDFQPHCRIGPGLQMPHPIGIIIAHGVLGRNVVLQHNITVSPVRTNWRSGRSPGLFQVGDNVTVFTGAVVAGPVAIGDGAMVGANALVTEDVPADHLYSRGRARPVSEAERQGIA